MAKFSEYIDDNRYDEYINYQKLVPFLKNIFKLQQELVSTPPPQIEAVAFPDHEDILRGFREGQPVFSHLTLENENIQLVTEKVVNRLIQDYSQSENLEKALSSWKLDFEQQLSEYDRQISTQELTGFIQNLAETGPLPPGISTLICTFSLNSLGKLIFKAKPADLNTSLWKGGNCPSCGLSPHYGFLRESDHKRIMECWFCNTRWEFPRLKCAYCTNEDQYQLGFFIIQADNQTGGFRDHHSCRVNFCDVCKTYNKIFFVGEEKESLTLLYQNYITIFHDLAAVKEGYMPGSGLYWDE